ncbi:hypothetical protein [Corynebacterium halotolerans]|uniref:Uncharacterized protein n=1 Tax=Corynebacterium halotolerans YIM 70093 = DSM 44683 TaxID=1121362 RepID=M1NNQ3_9CORY|nr:hypothetical protein [Corynebacterium halotolerans]AGF72968.1 hypothetical protein A605_09830 [Corynebacterium halotolerans YIM 70093 = DSM 44683]
MGRSLTLVPVEEDPDLDEIRRIFATHGLSSGTRTPLLVDAAGNPPRMGGQELAFESSWLGEGARSFYGQIYNAALNEQQCALIYELAVAGNLVLAPDGGPPHLVVCGRTHEPDEVHDESAPPWLEVVCFVDSADELHRALHGRWEPFCSTHLDRGTIWGPRAEWPTDEGW